MPEYVLNAGKMPLNIRLYFKSGNTQLLERINYTEKLRQQINDRIKAGIIVDFDVF